MIILSLSFLVLFALTNFTPIKDFLYFEITIVGGFLALISLIVACFGYFYKSNKYRLIVAHAVFISMLVAVSSIIYSTGGLVSPFVGLWFIIAFVAPAYGVFGMLWIFIALGFQLGDQYLNNPDDIAILVTKGIIALIPLALGGFMWLTKVSERDTSTKAIKKLSNELSQIATQSEIIINAIGDGVIAIDKTGKVMIINPAAQLITGWPKLDAVTLHYKSILQLVDSQNRPVSGSLDPVEGVLNTNQQVRNNDLVLVTHSGKKLLLSILVSPIGELGSGAIVVFRDITKEKTEEREQAEFISTASHEMRTPVAAIEGYLGLAMSPQVSQIDDKAREYLTKARESAQHLGRLFQDLLDVSKADDGRLTNSPKVVNVTKFTQDIVSSMQAKASEKGVALVFKPQPENSDKHIAPVFYTNVDNDHLREILNNLIENALKYTLQGEVLVDIIGDDEQITVSVKDTGIGIPAEDMSHLFQKFYRVNNAETNQIGGTGLGLYLCRRLVETIGGRIWAESEYKKGSTFFIEVPRVSNDLAKSLISEQARQSEPIAQSQILTQSSDSTSSLPAPQGISNNQSAQVVDIVKPSATNNQIATNVPRSERLTPEQIAEHVARLKQMAQEQSQVQAPNTTNTPPMQQTMQPVITKERRGDLRIPQRNL